MKAFEGFLLDKKEAVVQVLLIVGIGVLSSLLAKQLVWRADLTEDNRYTLSKASEEIAEGIDDPVTVTAYFSSELPPNLELVKDEFRNFLDEFRAYSEGNLEYEFVNPNENDETEQQAQQQQIQPLLINVRERDQVSQKRAYLGAVFRYEDKKEVLPVVRPGSSLEYDIALTIKKLIATEKPKIGLLQGHGEASRGSMPQAIQQLQQLYQVEEVSGIDTTEVPADIEVLAVVSPTQQLGTEELLAIDQYIMRGGKVIFAVNRVNANLQTGRGQPVNTGIENLLASYNIPVQSNLVRDLSSSEIQVQSRQGFFNVINNVRYPYIPVAPNFGEHPVSGGLESVVFPFVSALDTGAVDSTQQLTVLVSSSERSGTASGFYNLDPMQEWKEQDFTEANIPLAAAVEGSFTSAFAQNDTLEVPLKSSANTAIVVIGDGDFVVNGSGQQQQQLPEDNISFFVNAVDWLADDTGLIALRTKGITNRPLEQIEDGTKTFLKYLNVLLPIFLAGAYGLHRYRKAERRRQHWKEEGV